MAVKKNQKKENEFVLEGLPEPQNGRMYGQVMFIEHKTESGIIIPSSIATIQKRDDQGRVERGANNNVLIIRIIAVAPNLQKVNVEVGDMIVVDNGYLQQQTVIGTHEVVIIHEIDVLGIWKQEKKEEKKKKRK